MIQFDGPFFITNKSPWTMFCRKKIDPFDNSSRGVFSSIRRHWCSTVPMMKKWMQLMEIHPPENHMEPEHESPKNMSPFWSISAISSPDFNPVQRLWMGPPFFFRFGKFTTLRCFLSFKYWKKNPCGNDAIHQNMQRLIHAQENACKTNIQHLQRGAKWFLKGVNSPSLRV